MTLDPGDDQSPIWSPEGTRIVFNSDRKGASGNLYEMRADSRAAKSSFSRPKTRRPPNRGRRTAAR